MQGLTDLTLTAAQDQSPDGLGSSNPSLAKQAERQRLAIALRENLKRRKAQVRNRRSVVAEETPATNT